MWRQTKKGKKQKISYSFWSMIFFFCVDSSESRETLCTLNSPNLTTKLMPPNHQNHPAMSLRYTLMLKYHPLSCLVERIQTPHSQRMRILKLPVSEWNKCMLFPSREVRIGENCAQVLGHRKRSYARSSGTCRRKIDSKSGPLVTKVVDPKNECFPPLSGNCQLGKIVVYSIVILDPCWGFYTTTEKRQIWNWILLAFCLKSKSNFSPLYYKSDSRADLTETLS